jgi:hypothetical protein
MTNIYSITETNTLIGNTSNYSFNISNILKANIDANNSTINTTIINTSTYASNISNILTIRDATNLINTSNYASNISNIIIANNSNFTLGTAINTSNYVSNISNIILTLKLSIRCKFKIKKFIPKIAATRYLRRALKGIFFA